MKTTVKLTNVAKLDYATIISFTLGGGVNEDGLPLLGKQHNIALAAGTEFVEGQEIGLTLSNYSIEERTHTFKTGEKAGQTFTKLWLRSK